MISLAEHFVEMSLSVPRPAADGLVQILSLLGFRIAAAVNAPQPSVATASDDLTDFSCDRDTSAGVAHTNGTLRDAIELTCWGLEG